MNRDYFFVCSFNSLMKFSYFSSESFVASLIRKSTNGFKGPIYTTGATAQLVDILWHDSARLMAEEAEWKTRKALRRGLPAVLPLYGESEADAALKCLRPLEWEENSEGFSRCGYYNGKHLRFHKRCQSRID